MSIYTRKEMAMLYDASKCTGCKGCQVACKQWNVLYSDLGMNAFPFSGSYQNPQDLNGSNRLVMTFKEKKSDNQLPSRRMGFRTPFLLPLHQRRLRYGLPDGLSEVRRKRCCLRFSRKVHRLPLLRNGLPVRRSPLLRR